ncbi:MAG TPA: hypothetical protein VGJ60_07135 [Chloroflexota bacterium]|jgi:hypothetical protein
MATQTKQQDEQAVVTVDLSARIAAAMAERESARELLKAARMRGDPAEVAVAEGMVKDALKAYRQLERAPTAQEALADALQRIKAEEAAKPASDTTRLSGTEMRRKAKARTTPTVAAAESDKAAVVKERQEVAEAAASDAQIGAYLEPRMQELLANQTLRGEALRWTRRLITWLAEADGHCISNQPVLARKFLGLVKSELMAQEQALKDAQAERPRAASTKKGKGAK